MTLEDLTLYLSQRPQVDFVAAAMLGAPLLTWLVGIAHRRGEGGRAPWRNVYAVLVYGVCVPGILAATLTGYLLFFTRQSLMQVNLVVFVLPILSMCVSLALIRRRVAFDAVPGFDRLGGLMLVIALTFAIVLAIEKTRIWLFFGSSFATLLVIVAVLFALLRWGLRLLFDGSSKRRRGAFP